MTEASSPHTGASSPQMWPLYAAGFTTAFGAHGIAANLGGHSEDAVTSSSSWADCSPSTTAPRSC